MNPSCRSFATSATWSIGAVSAEPERTTLSRDPPSNLLVRGWPFESKCEHECMAANGQRASERQRPTRVVRSEEHTSELQSLMHISYAVLCLKKKTAAKTLTTSANS